MKKISELIIAYGHENILGKHKTTIEITKQNYLTKNGDCIIAIKSNKGCYDINEELKNELILGKKIKVSLLINGKTDEIVAQGSPKLTFKDKNSIIIRKSNFIDDRTLAILANKSSIDINRDIINDLKKIEKKILISIEIM